MRLKKKALCVLVSLLSLAFFTSCSIPNTKKTPSDLISTIREDINITNKELTIAVFEGAYGKAYWEEMIKRFEADFPGVHVTMISNPKIMDIIKPLNISGNPPDFIYAPLSDQTNTVQKMLNEKAFLDLTDVFDSNALDKDVPLKDIMMDDILQFAKPYGDDKIYMAPNYMTTEGLWYNKTLFEQKGWTPPRTWDEFWALGELAKQEGLYLFTYQGIYPGYLASILWPSIASLAGADSLNSIMNFEKGSFQTEAVKKSLGLFQTMADNENLMPGSVALNHTQAQTEFLKGKTLFIPNGNWFEGEMKDIPRAEGFEFGFIPPPTFQADEQQYALISFEAMFIPAKAKNAELAKLFLKYQYMDEIIKLNSEKSTGVIAIKNGAELAKDYLPASVYNSATVFERGVKPVIFKWRRMPITEINIENEVFNTVSDIMHRHISIDQATERVEKLFSNIRVALGKIN